MPVQFTVLASGSGGNCALVETPRTRVLIDAGVSGRQIEQRLATINRTLDQVDAILLTHEHNDHTNGLNILCNRRQVPLYANRLTADAVRPHLPGFRGWRLFDGGAAFEIGDITVVPVPVPHDAIDPLGFILECDGSRIGVFIDLGHCTKLVLDRMRTVHVLLLETNHDLKMLMDDPRRPWSLKQRIASRHGHLSNVAAANALRQIRSACLRHVYLAHISRDCNRPELAHQTVRAALDEIGAMHTEAHLTSQHTPCPTLELEPEPAAALNGVSP